MLRVQCLPDDYALTPEEVQTEDIQLVAWAIWKHNLFPVGVLCPNPDGLVRFVVRESRLWREAVEDYNTNAKKFVWHSEAVRDVLGIIRETKTTRRSKGA